MLLQVKELQKSPIEVDSWAAGPCSMRLMVGTCSKLRVDRRDGYLRDANLAITTRAIISTEKTQMAAISAPRARNSALSAIRPLTMAEPRSCHLIKLRAMRKTPPC